MGLSTLGIFHTAIGIIALIAGFVSFIKFGKIDLSRSAGKIYFYGTIIAALSALGLTKHGFLNPGHIFSIVVAIIAGIAFILAHRKRGNNRARFFENFLLSFSFFLSLIPTVNETFTRVPVGHPLAASPSDPLIKNTLLILLVLFIAGSVFQFLMQKKINKKSLL